MGAAKTGMKSQKGSKIATGKRRKSSVFRGFKEKTSGGLKKTDLTKSKEGKVVSKKMSASSKKNFRGSAAQKWLMACKAARIALNLKGFVPIKKGSPFYNK